MKDYLKERRKALQLEYSNLLSIIGNSIAKDNESQPNNSQNWVDLQDKKSRISEIDMVSEFFKENNYTNQ